MAARFRNRQDAGRTLAARLSHYAGRPDVLVLGLPRGGVPVAFEVARELRVPLDVFVVRKLGLPWHEELAMGAIATGGVRLIDKDVVRQFGVTEAAIEKVVTAEQRELKRRERQYRGDRPPADVAGRTVVLVDDGLATGSSMRVAIAALRQEHPERIVVAVPLAPHDTCEMLKHEADEVVCALTPEPFYAVGLWYEDFSQTSDEEVHELLERARREEDHMVQDVSEERTVHVDGGEGVTLEGSLAVPPNPRGVVLFAHGSGSSRHSPRNRYVAESLRDAGIGTLLVDLLTMEEEEVDLVTRHHRFDIGLLASRLAGAIDWLANEQSTRGLSVGLFGASTGGGAALVVAADRPTRVAAIVSRGGRPDLAGAALPRVRAPTLLIVGERDEPVIQLNREAMAQMHAPLRLEIVAGATHLFEEPGALEEVARLAGDWFVLHLPAG